VDPFAPRRPRVTRVEVLFSCLRNIPTRGDSRARTQYKYPLLLSFLFNGSGSSSDTGVHSHRLVLFHLDTKRPFRLLSLPCTCGTCAFELAKYPQIPRFIDSVPCISHDSTLPKMCDHVEIVSDSNTLGAVPIECPICGTTGSSGATCPGCGNGYIPFVKLY